MKERIEAAIEALDEVEETCRAAVSWSFEGCTPKHDHVRSCANAAIVRGMETKMWLQRALAALGVTACLVGCASEVSEPVSSSSPLYATQTVPCAGRWADALYDSPNARYNVLALIERADSSLAYQLPAFEPRGDKVRATVSCVDGDVVEFRDYTPTSAMNE